MSGCGLRPGPRLGQTEQGFDDKLTLPTSRTGRSINVEGVSKALSTRDVMLVSAAYSGSHLIERNQGIWNFDVLECAGTFGHTSRTAGCANHQGHDNFDTADRFNIAIYGGNLAIVPNWLNTGVATVGVTSSSTCPYLDLYCSP